MIQFPVQPRDGYLDAEYRALIQSLLPLLISQRIKQGGPQR